MSIYSLRKEKNKQTLKRNIIYSVLALAFLIPLNDFLATVALIVGVFLIAWRFFLHRLLKLTTLPLDTPILIFACISLTSCFVSPDKFFSFYNLTHTLGIYILVYFLIAQSPLELEDMKNLLFAMLGGFSLCVLYGLYQAVFGISVSDITWVDPEAFPELKRRIFSTWQNPNIFAGYIAMILALLLGLFVKSKVYREKAIYILLALMGAIALALTYSRASMLAVVAVFLFYGSLKDKRIILVTLSVIIVGLAVNPLIFERIASVFTSVDTSTEMRFAFYEATVAMIEDHPLLGCGWGVYYLVYPEYDFYMQGAPIKIVHAHNIYLNYAAEVGIIGALSFFWFFFGTIKLALFGYSEDEDNVEEVQQAVKKAEPLSEEKLAKIQELTALLNLIAQKKEESGEVYEVMEEVYIEEPVEVVEKKPFTFEEFWKEPIFKDYESIRDGLSLGIGLAFAVVALNGLFDDLLFNIPTSMFLWMLAALAAKNLQIKEN